MIEISDLKVEYKNRDKKIVAIQNVNFKINEGEICVIVGPSGGGKSTLLKVLAGIIKNYEGRALINGEEINPRVHRIGFIPQDYGLIKWKTAEENILLSAKIKDGKKGIDRAYYEEILKRLKIREIRNRYPRELSGGQRQRISIARAFLLKPDLLLMDESFSALDAMTREGVQELFLEAWREHKVTTILITHDVREAIYLGEKIVVFSSTPGQVIKSIENSLFSRPYLELSQEYGQLRREIIGILKGDNKDEAKGI